MSVAYPEGRRVRNANGQVGKDSQHAVRKRRFEGQVVRNLMNGQEEVLVRRRANNVRCQEGLP